MVLQYLHIPGPVQVSGDILSSKKSKDLCSYETSSLVENAEIYHVILQTNATVV